MEHVSTCVYVCSVPYVYVYICDVCYIYVVYTCTCYVYMCVLYCCVYVCYICMCMLCVCVYIYIEGMIVSRYGLAGLPLSDAGPDPLSVHCRSSFSVSVLSSAAGWFKPTSRLQFDACINLRIALSKCNHRVVMEKVQLCASGSGACSRGLIS